MLIKKYVFQDPQVPTKCNQSHKNVILLGSKEKFSGMYLRDFKDLIAFGNKSTTKRDFANKSSKADNRIVMSINTRTQPGAVKRLRRKSRKTLV